MAVQGDVILIAVTCYPAFRLMYHVTGEHVTLRLVNFLLGLWQGVSMDRSAHRPQLTSGGDPSWPLVEIPADHWWRSQLTSGGDPS